MTSIPNQAKNVRNFANDPQRGPRERKSSNTAREGLDQPLQFFSQAIDSTVLQEFPVE
jgi:hypothetical protein